MLSSLVSILLIIFVIQVGFFIIALLFRTDKVTDLAYGTTFAVIALWLYLTVSAQSWLALTMLCCVMLWGLRLSGYLFMRILSIGHDARFDEIRGQWRSFAKFWLLQTIAIFILLLPVIAVMYYTPRDIQVWLVPSVGIALWLVGWVIEVVADWQKRSYKKQHPHHWIDTGLRAWSRHPNYLGEILVWLGIWVMAIPVLSGRWWLSILSPVLIIVLLLWVSGIPPLEAHRQKKYGKDIAFQQYKKTTPLLFPRRW